MHFPKEIQLFLNIWSLLDSMSSWVTTGTGAKWEHSRTSWEKGKKGISLFARGSQTTHCENVFDLQDHEFVDSAFNTVESSYIYLIFRVSCLASRLRNTARQRIAKKISSAVDHHLLGCACKQLSTFHLQKWICVTTKLWIKVKHDSL